MGSGLSTAGAARPTELAWFTPGLSILDYHDIVWRLEGDRLVKADAVGADQVYTVEYRRILKRFAVVKMDPLGPGLYVRSREYPTKTVGYIPLGRGEPLLMEHDGSTIDVTRHRDRLFVASDSEIVQFRGGRRFPFLTATEEIAFLRVNVVVIDEVAHVAVLSSTKDYSTVPTATLALYRIEDSMD
jgi:hypothetical protein